MKSFQQKTIQVKIGLLKQQIQNIQVKMTPVLKGTKWKILITFMNKKFGAFFDSSLLVLLSTLVHFEEYWVTGSAGNACMRGLPNCP